MATPRTRDLCIAALVIAVLAVAVWVPGFTGPYHFDDAVTPLDDPASQSLTAFAGNLRRTIRPVTKLTYATEASLGIASPVERRALSAAFSAAAAVMVLLLLTRRPGQLPVIVAAPIAALWAVHPIHAEAVLSIAGRTAALSGLLLLAGLVAQARERPALAAGCYFLAGLARETAVAGIAVFVVAELAASRRPLREHVRRLAPLLLAALLLVGWLASLPRYRALADYSFTGRPYSESVVREVAAIPIGLSLYARPGALSLDHGELLPAQAASGLFITGMAVVLGAIAGLLVSLRRRTSPLVPIGIAGWLVAILPTQSLIPKLDPLAERPLTLALAGLLLALAPLVAHRPDRLRLPRFVIALAICAAAAGATIARARLYRSDLLLWADAADKSPGKARPHVNYAMALLDAGRRDDAERELRIAAGIDPFDASIARQLGALVREAR